MTEKKPKAIKYGERMCFSRRTHSCIRRLAAGCAGRKAVLGATTNSASAVRRLLREISDEYRVSDDVAIHRTATVEPGALVKAPAIIGPRCFIAAGSLIRGRCWLEENCIIGPGCELKSSFLFAGSKLAHFNFVGDSVVGARVSFEAGSIIANFRNECADPRISILHAGEIVETGVEKFGAHLSAMTVSSARTPLSLPEQSSNGE